jgi:hypothetical protein
VLVLDGVFPDVNFVVGHEVAEAGGVLIDASIEAGGGGEESVNGLWDDANDGCV